MSPNATWRSELAWWLAAAVAAGAAFWIGSGPTAGLIALGSMLTTTAVVHYGRRRSDTAQIVAGVGDERTRDLYGRATAAAGTVLGVVIPVWWLVTVARGDGDSTLLVLSLLFSASFVGSAAYYSRRS